MFISGDDKLTLITYFCYIEQTFIKFYTSFKIKTCEFFKPTIEYSGHNITQFEIISHIISLNFCLIGQLPYQVQLYFYSLKYIVSIINIPLDLI